METNNEKYGLPQEVLDKLLCLFRQYPAISAVHLYGSRAKGNYREGSDIYICLVSDTLNLKDLLRIENQIDDLLLPWEVDLCLQKDIENPDLLSHIERVGINLYETDIP